MQSFAQRFGVQGGLNLANMVMKDDEDTYSDEFEMNLGFNAGVTFELSFGDFLGLEMVPGGYQVLKLRKVKQFH
jgi:hypothetical protein